MSLYSYKPNKKGFRKHQSFQTPIITVVPKAGLEPARLVATTPSR